MTEPSDPILRSRSFGTRLIKLRVYEGQEEDWRLLQNGGLLVSLTPTGYRDGTDAEFTFSRMP